MPLTVGFDATAAARQSAGIGRYARELLRALAQQDDGTRFRLFYASGSLPENHMPPLPGRFRVRRLPLSDRITNAVWHRTRLPIPIQPLIGGFDLFHSPDFTAPPVMRKPVVITVHDLAFERRPECAYPTLREYLKRVVPRAARSATHIIAVSEQTKRDLIELYGIDPARITVVYEGVAAVLNERPTRYVARSLVARLGIEDPYILSVGTLEPRKNYPRLLEAYGMLRDRGERRRLVIAGGRGWLYEPIFKRLDELHLRDHVNFVQPNDAHLAALYAAADAFVYPSLYEGFGIPPLESLAAGVPSAVSSSSSIPEVVGDAAVVFDPEDSEAIADALNQVLNDAAVRSRLAHDGPARAALFGWPRAAQETVAVYRRVARG
jgi:glycosyltransferase involved in cell wall biosynthesis